MHYQLKLKDGSSVNLSFSLYFLDRFCKLSDLGLQSGISHILGEQIDTEQGLVIGGILGDLTIRANVIAAGIEAYHFANKRFDKMTTLDGYEICEKVPNSLSNICWGEIFAMVLKSLIPEGLPKTAAVKKKVVPKSSRR